MKKIFVMLIVLLMGVVGYIVYQNYSSNSCDNCTEMNVLASADIPGVLLKEESGYSGAEYELLSKTFNKMEEKFTMKDVKFPIAIKTAIESKENVIVAGGFDYEFHKEEIEKNRLHAVIYGDLHPQLVHAKEVSKKLGLLSAKIKVAIQTGAYRPKLTNVKATVEFVEYPEISDMIRAIEEKQVDAVILDSDAKSFKDKFKNFTFTGLAKRKACFIFSSKTSKEYVEKFEKAMKEVLATKTSSKGESKCAIKKDKSTEVNKTTSSSKKSGSPLTKSAKKESKKSA